MRSLRLYALVGAVMIAARMAINVVSDSIDRCFRLIFETFSPEPPLELVGGTEGFGGFFVPAYPDPHVPRHEAGMATLAAARGR